MKKFVGLLLNIFSYVEDCMVASGNISMFFKESATASEKILTRWLPTTSILVVIPRIRHYQLNWNYLEN